MEPGYYEDLPMKDYHHSRTGVSKSGLSTILSSSPKKYRFYLDKSSPSSPALEFGTAVHALVLEPDVFYKEYIMVPNDLRRGTKKWKELMGENPGKLAMKENEWNNAHLMRDSILAHPLGGKLIQSSGPVESTSIWIDEETGIKLKCRPDKLAENHGMVVDLKTAKDIREEAFMWDAAKFKYHMSVPMTLAGLAQQTELPAYSDYVFLVVEKDPPFDCAVYVYDFDAIEQGRRDMRAALKLLNECIKQDKWPGMGGGTVYNLSLPDKYLKKN